MKLRGPDPNTYRAWDSAQQLYFFGWCLAKTTDTNAALAAFLSGLSGEYARSLGVYLCKSEES